MLERETDTIIAQLCALTIGDRDTIVLREILASEIPRGIKKYVQAETVRWLADELFASAKFAHVDPGVAGIRRLSRAFLEAMSEGYRYSRDEFLSLLENSVHFVENYLCRPQWTIENFAFEGCDRLALDVLLSKLECMVDYAYFKSLIGQIARRRGLREIGPGDLRTMLAAIDDQIVKQHNARELALLAKPIFDFLLLRDTPPDIGIPLKPILVFFEDKKMRILKEYIESVCHIRNRQEITLDELTALVEDHYIGHTEGAISRAAVEGVQSVPEKTGPDEVEPRRAGPIPAEPKGPEPRLPQAIPLEAKPAQAEPPSADAAKARWAELIPAEPKPEEPRPAEAKPAEREPAKAEPARAGEVEAAWTELKPAEPKPEEPRLADEKPVETEPARADEVKAPWSELIPTEPNPAELKLPEGKVVRAEGQRAEPGPEGPEAAEEKAAGTAPPQQKPEKPEATGPRVKEPEKEESAWMQEEALTVEIPLDLLQDVTGGNVQTPSIFDSVTEEPDGWDVSPPPSNAAGPPVTAPAEGIHKEPAARKTPPTDPRNPSLSLTYAGLIEGGRKLPDLNDFIQGHLRNRFIRRLFDHDDRQYEEVIAALNGAGTWKLASIVLSKFYTENNLDPFDADVVEFTDIIHHRYADPAKDGA